MYIRFKIVSHFLELQGGCTCMPRDKSSKGETWVSLLTFLYSHFYSLNVLVMFCIFDNINGSCLDI